MRRGENNHAILDIRYDSLGPVIREDQTINVGADRTLKTQELTSTVQKTVTSSFDGLGNRTQLAYPGGTTVNETYDELGRKKLVQDGDVTQVQYMYAGAGYRVLEKRLPSAVTTLHRSYDGDRRVTRHDQRRTTDDQRISGFTYAWDRVGNRHYERTLTNNTNTSETGGDGEAFTYDSVYRMRGYYQDVASASLNSVSNNSPELGVSLTYTGTYRSYDLDGVGNRLDVSADGVVESAYLLEGDDASTNQYSFIDDAFQAYDPAGNLLDDGDRQFAYGHRNQLLRAVKDSTDARYRYDVLGRRVSKRLSSGNFSGLSYGHSVYVHFGSDLIEEYDTSGNLRKEWIYGIRIDEPIRMRAPDYADLDNDENISELVDLYYLTNSLGTVTALVTTAGAVAERYVYDVWGVILDVIDSDGASTGASWTLVGNPWCYTGRQFEFEERSGLYHYRARDYRPEAGQFLQRDPLGWAGTFLGGTRPYASASPARRVDPLGLKDYTLGWNHPVLPRPDPGAGTHGSEASTWYMRLLRRMILAKPVSASSPNALRHLKHYFDNTGSTLSVDLESLLRDSTAARNAYVEEQLEAMEFAEKNLSAGKHDITSRRVREVYVSKDDSWDWFYAVGGFVVWGRANVEVTRSGATRCFKMSFDFRFHDRYNWDKGKGVSIGLLPVSDEFMGEFHRQGIAREFDMVGQKTEEIRWAN